MSKSSVAETALKKLRRIESNMICPNCGTAAPMGIGFGNVCIKFKTFVCDLCKTSHQAISHRVKSITMSNWTIEEVRELSTQQFGGNEACLHTWLGNAPKFGAKYPGGTRPKEGDKIEFFKQFVIDCYENGKFRATTPYVPSGADASAFAAEPKKQAAKAESAVKVRTPVSGSADNLSTQFKAAVQVNDLLDNDSFDQFQTASGSASPFDPFGGGAQQASFSPKGGAGLSFDEFAADSGTPSPVPQYFSAPAAANNSFINQSFDAFSAPPAAAPVNNSFNNSRNTNSDFGGLLSAAPPSVLSSTPVDLFGSDSVLQPIRAGATTQQPLGSNSSGGSFNNSSNFGSSGLGGLSMPNSTSSGGNTPTAVIGGKVSVMLAPPVAPLGGMRMNNGMAPPNNGGGGYGGNNNFNNGNNGQNGGGAMAFNGLSNPNSFGVNNNNSGAGTGGVMGGGNSNARAPAPVSSSTMGGGFRPQGGASSSGGAAITGGKPSGLTGASAISNLADFNLGVLTPNNPAKASNNARPAPQTSSFDFLQSTMQHHLKTSGVPSTVSSSPATPVGMGSTLSSKSASNQPVMLNNQHLNFNGQGQGGLSHSASAPGGMNHMGGGGGQGFGGPGAFNSQGHGQPPQNNSFAGLGVVNGGGGMSNNNNNRGGNAMGGAPMGSSMNNNNNAQGPGGFGGMGGSSMGGGNMSAMGGGGQFRGNQQNPSNPFKM